MWTVTIDGARIILGAHIDDFVIACANQQVPDGFRARLLDAFEGTYEGALQHYLECEVTRDMEKGTTLSVPDPLRRRNSTHLQFLECHSSPYTHAAKHAPQKRRL